MENISFDSIDEVDDISTLDGYKVARAAGLSEKEALRAVEKSSRDNARTPFQWDGSENAGFTTGKPWLRVNPNYTEINLADQRNDPDSVFNFYRQLTRLRKNPDYQETFTCAKAGASASLSWATIRKSRRPFRCHPPRKRSC